MFTHASLLGFASVFLSLACMCDLPVDVSTDTTQYYRITCHVEKWSSPTCLGSNHGGQTPSKELSVEEKGYIPGAPFTRVVSVPVVHIAVEEALKEAIAEVEEILKNCPLSSEEEEDGRLSGEDSLSE